MATRRNVPSKDAFRATRTTLATSALNWQKQVRDTSFVTGKRRYNINTSSVGQCTSHRSLLLLSLHKQIVRRMLQSYLHLESSYKPTTFLRAFSLSRNSSSTAGAQPSKDAHSLDREDGAEHPHSERPLQILRVYHSSAAPGKEGNAENESLLRKTVTDKGRARLRLLDSGPSLRILRIQYPSADMKKKGKHAGVGDQRNKTTTVQGGTHSSPPETKLKLGERSGDSTSLMPPYIAPNQPVPVYIPHRAAFYGERTSRSLDPRYGYLYSRILLVRDSHGDLLARQVAVSILNSYVISKLDMDWQLVRELYMGLCYRFAPDELRVIRNSFIRMMLKESPPRLEAVSLLLVPTESGSPVTARHIRSYLADFCAEVSDSDLQLAEAEKILQGIPEAASALRTAVLIPLVRNALEAKNPDRARDLIAKLTKTYGLPTDFHVLTDLTRYHAREGDWSATDALLEDLHFRGYSRSKPYAFAALVRTIYHHFAAVRNPSRMFDFLTYSMRNQGLVPTTMLSASVIRDFVSFRRYDLVQRFVHARQEWFPNILSPIDTSLAAYEISEAWTHSGASPTEVFATCKALAYGSVRDPFSEEFRHMTNTYLLRLLYKLLRVLTRQIGIEEHDPSVEHSSSLEAMFVYIDQLSNSVSSKAFDLRSALLFNTFRRQAEAAHDAKFLVNDFQGYIQQRGMIPKLETDQIQAKKSAKKAIYSPDLLAEILGLPGHDLTGKVLDHYRNTDSSEKGGDRDVVVTVIRYLQQNQRHRDCTILVQQFWRSCRPENKVIIHEVIKCWLRLAFELRDAKTLHEALWAAVDADPVHITGYRLSILIRAAMSVIMEEVHLGRLKQYPNQLEELKYLVSRCYRRRWQQDGYPETENIADPYLKRWKMEQDNLEQDATVLVRTEYIF